MRSTSRCADCWTCLTLLTPPDPASSGLDRARVVSLRICCFRFLVKNPNCLFVGIGTCQIGMLCHEGKRLSTTSINRTDSWTRWPFLVRGSIPGVVFFFCCCRCCCRSACCYTAAVAAAAAAVRHRVLDGQNCCWFIAFEGSGPWPSLVGGSIPSVLFFFAVPMFSPLLFGAVWFYTWWVPIGPDTNTRYNTAVVRLGIYLTCIYTFRVLLPLLLLLCVAILLLQ